MTSEAEGRECGEWVWQTFQYVDSSLFSNLVYVYMDICYIILCSVLYVSNVQMDILMSVRFFMLGD